MLDCGLVVLNRRSLSFWRRATSFPGLSCEDERSEKKALVWVGHVIWAYLTATRQGVAKYSNWNIQVFETNKHPKHFSIERYYLCIAKFGTNQLKSLKTAPVFSKIYRRTQTSLFLKNSDEHMASLHEVLSWREKGEGVNGKSALEMRDAWQLLVDFLQQSMISCKLWYFVVVYDFCWLCFLYWPMLIFFCHLSVNSCCYSWYISI
jgi:hypothetical protein